MELTQDTLIGLAILLAIAVVIALLVLKPGKRERIELTREEDAPERTLKPLPKAPPPLEPTPIPPQPTEHGDDLLKLKGVGPKVATTLANLGVTRFDQIAAWNDEDLARIDAQLGAFKGRPARDQWVEQARLLTSGDMAAYETKFGKL